LIQKNYQKEKKKKQQGLRQQQQQESRDHDSDNISDIVNELYSPSRLAEIIEEEDNQRLVELVRIQEQEQPSNNSKARKE
jgi:hypothetical protein